MHAALVQSAVKVHQLRLDRPYIHALLAAPHDT